MSNEHNNDGPSLASIQSKLVAAQNCHHNGVQTLIEEAIGMIDEVARQSIPASPVTCGNSCDCLVQCGDTYAHTGRPKPPPTEKAQAPATSQAMAVVTEAMRNDLDYAWSWHCNIAMASVDEGMDHYAANKAAARFMSMLADVDTTKHPGFPPAVAPAPAVPQDYPVLPESVCAAIERCKNMPGNPSAWVDMMRAIRTAIGAAPAPAVPPVLSDERVARFFGRLPENVNKYEARLVREIEQAVRAQFLTAPSQEPSFCDYCGGNDEDPQDHCMDCERPSQPVTLTDDAPDPTLSALMGMPVSREVWGEFKAWQSNKEAALREKEQPQPDAPKSC